MVVDRDGDVAADEEPHEPRRVGIDSSPSPSTTTSTLTSTTT
jgi:hypothetical protein